MKYLNIKMTVWQRLIIPDETNSEELIAFIKEVGIDYILDQINIAKESKILWGTHES